MTEAILSKIGIQQRVLPAYRAPFFDLLAAACNSGLSVFAGSPAPAEALGATGELQEAHQVLAENLHLGHGRYYACVQKNILAWLEDWQPEVLIAEANPRYLNTPKAVRWMKSRERPVIGWGLGAPPVRGFWRKLLRERFLGGFDALLTYSQLGADQYRTMGFPPERIFVAPNAVSKRPVQEIPSRPAEYADGRASVLFVGRLQARKRVDLLLRACADLPERQRPRLTIVGDGPASGDLRALAAEIYPRAVFTGELRGEALAQYFRAADVFVLPGTGGLAVQEAMGWGLSVIVAEAYGRKMAGRSRLGMEACWPPVSRMLWQTRRVCAGWAE